MRSSTLLLAAIFAALLASSATAWPYHPHHPHHPHFPFPGSPSSTSEVGKPPLPARDDVAKCLQTVRGDGTFPCGVLNFSDEKCCMYLSDLGESCDFVPYYRSYMFKGLLSYVCDKASSSSPPPSS